jgi:hypothetical protein
MKASRWLASSCLLSRRPNTLIGPISTAALTSPSTLTSTSTSISTTALLLSRFSTTSTVHPAVHLLSHLTAPSLNISVQDAFLTLQEQPELTVEFIQDLQRGGFIVSHADKYISVIDYSEQRTTNQITSLSIDTASAAVGTSTSNTSSSTTRSLHFNDTLDLVQSAIALDASGMRV